MKGNIIILAEHNQGRLERYTYELLNLALLISNFIGSRILFLLIGADVDALAQELAENTGIDVIAIHNPNLPTYNAEIYKNILEEIIPELEAEYLLSAQTTQGMDLASGIAVRLNASCITGVNSAFFVEGKVLFRRPSHKGKIMLDVAPSADLAVVTLQPGALAAAVNVTERMGSVQHRSSNIKSQKTRTLGVRKARNEDPGLVEADVIVAAGRGIGDRDSLSLIQEFASLFPKSAVAGSRPLCDQNWLDYRHQVGLTGSKVAPKLYIACGISGATQHVCGMTGSEFIVAISTDPNAAIFNIADVCIIDDLKEFIPAFVEVYGKEKTK